MLWFWKQYPAFSVDYRTLQVQCLSSGNVITRLSRCSMRTCQNFYNGKWNRRWDYKSFSDYAACLLAQDLFAPCTRETCNTFYWNQIWKTVTYTRVYRVTLYRRSLYKTYNCKLIQIHRYDLWKLDFTDIDWFLSLCTLLKVPH